MQSSSFDFFFISGKKKTFYFTQFKKYAGFDTSAMPVFYYREVLV